MFPLKNLARKGLRYAYFPWFALHCFMYDNSFHYLAIFIRIASLAVMY